MKETDVTHENYDRSRVIIVSLENHLEITNSIGRHSKGNHIYYILDHHIYKFIGMTYLNECVYEKYPVSKELSEMWKKELYDFINKERIY